jgi:hypothetical protein
MGVRIVSMHKIYASGIPQHRTYPRRINLMSSLRGRVIKQRFLPGQQHRFVTRFGLQPKQQQHLVLAAPHLGPQIDV